MTSQTYYGHIDSIKGNAIAIEKEKLRLDTLIGRLVAVLPTGATHPSTGVLPTGATHPWWQMVRP